MSSSIASSTSATSTGTSSKEKEPFKVRAELFAPTRLAPTAYALLRTRSLVTDVIAHECLLLALLIARTTVLTDVANGTAQQQLPRIGILGGGHIGSAVAMTLLSYGYPPEQLAISTRQPERTPRCEALLNATQAQLAQFHRVAKYFDNARLSRESNVLVLCMPPSQLKSVAIQIKHSVGMEIAAAGEWPPTVVVSALCGASTELLAKSCGSGGVRLVTRARVNVAELTAAHRDGDDDALRGGDPSTTVGNASGEGGDSIVDIAARELAREPQGVEALEQLVAALSLRLHSQHQHEQEQQSETLSQGSAASSSRASQLAHEILFGCCTGTHSVHTNPTRTRRASGRRDEDEGDGWNREWDPLLSALQLAMRRSKSSDHPASETVE